MERGAGPLEVEMRVATADWLEVLSIDGRFPAAQRAAAAARRSETEAFLATPVGDGDPRPRIAAIRAERMARRLNDERSVSRFRHLQSVLDPDAPVGPSVETLRSLWAPVRHVLELVGDGAACTTNGTFNRAMVQSISDRFDLRRGARPTAEHQALGVTELRELCRVLGLIRRSGKRILPTEAAGDAVDDTALWWRFAERGLPRDPFDVFCAETLLALVGSGALRTNRRVGPLVADIATEAGWREGTAPIGVDCVWGAQQMLWRLRMIGALPTRSFVPGDLDDASTGVEVARSLLNARFGAPLG